MVCTWSWKVSVVPSTSGAPPRLPCQKSWLTSTAGAAPCRCSSGTKRRPSGGRTPHHVEEVLGDDRAGARTGSCRPPPRWGPAPTSRPGLEAPALVAGRPGSSAPRRFPRSPGVDLPEVDDPSASGIGERLQQDAADHAEDRGGGADSEREGEHGDAVKPGLRARVRAARRRDRGSASMGLVAGGRLAGPARWTGSPPPRRRGGGGRVDERGVRQRYAASLRAADHPRFRCPRGAIR